MQCELRVFVPCPRANTPHVDLAFSSVEHIMRDVSYGWLLRYMHANGASLFFIVGAGVRVFF